MTDNPFANLGNDKPKTLPQNYEEVGGAFTCQSIGCWDVVHEAKYFDMEHLLTWKCKQGHINHVQDIVL